MQPAIGATDSKPVDTDDLNNKVKSKKVSASGGRLSNDGLAPLDADHLNRVHEELEKLNIATDVINKLELQLDEARAAFREIQTSWTQRLDQMTKKLGACIEKSRPYYEAKLEERRIRDEAQKAAIRFERANSMHAVAKQQVALTQDSLNRQNTKTVDAACLEVLNHHVQRVNEAEEERLMSEEEHRRVSQRIVDIAQRIRQFEKDQGRTIKKSRVYFDARVEFTRVLEQQKALIQRLEAEVRQKKLDYTTSLRNLEKISEAIHEERQIAGLKREQGVGCESPDPPPMEVARIDSEAPPPLLTSVLPNSPEQLPYDASSVNLRDRSISDPIDPSLFDDALKVPMTETKRPVSLGSGVILLAQQLTGIGSSWMADEEKRRAVSKAFTFPPEDVDVRYRTAPEGVKPLPTPPLPDMSDSDSEVGSLASGRGGFTDEELTLKGMLRSHTDLINEIDICAERLKQSMHTRSVSDAERESASGESSAGF